MKTSPPTPTAALVDALRDLIDLYDRMLQLGPTPAPAAIAQVEADLLALTASLADTIPELAASMGGSPAERRPLSAAS